ncbi:MAG: UDP-N-acetylmuramoyl-L-alanyl-D-glutamate--2,6-diaminopimelate ligase, partial [Proteobacteria bacterium]
MTQLKDLLYKVSIEAVKGSTEIDVRNIDFDSRNIGPDDVFVAIRGTVSNGHDFIEKAINLGATAIVCDTFPDIIVNGITYVQVRDTNKALAYIAANLYDDPSQHLKLVGITGTNGKTTVASLLYQLFKKAGFKSGLLSTVKIMVDEIEHKATHTTPDSLSINKYLREMADSGVDYCFMEVSSHGIHQKRSEGLHFAGGIFTNLSHDHLDYHPTFADYRDVKKAFFDHLPRTAFALTNIDDKNGLVMLQNTVAKKLTYALKTYADYKATILENQLSGLLLKINDQELWVRLIGTFNAYN